MLGRFIKHPLTGIITGILVAVILFFAAKSNVEPKYAVQESRLLAEVSDKTADLTLLWKKNKIHNLYSTDVLLWNAGDDYLDKKMFSETDRLRLCPNDNTVILQARFIKSSRETLKFYLSQDDDNGCLNINIIGDEAIESGDGGQINILYSGNQNSDFSIFGRIKGHKDGFKFTEWQDVVLKLDNFSKFVFPVVFLVQMSMFIYMVIRPIRIIASNKRAGKLVYFNMIMALTMLVIVCYMAYDKYQALIFGVSWAS